MKRPAGGPGSSRAQADRADVAAFRRRAGLAHLIDVHTHFMPERMLSKVWAYFEQAGPLAGRGWSIARVFKCHVQVGRFDPNDPLLREVWGMLAEAAVPVVTHCGSGPVAGAYTGPGPITDLLARHPRLRLVVAHLGMPEYREFLDLAERYRDVMLDTTMAFTNFTEASMPFPPSAIGRLEDLGDRILLGTDFPNIPYPYADALQSLERTGLGTTWLRAVCHDNAARLFAL